MEKNCEENLKRGEEEETGKWNNGKKIQREANKEKIIWRRKKNIIDRWDKK